MITGIAHINLLVPPGMIELANDFYGTTLGLTPVAVPQLQRGTLAWFDIPNSAAAPGGKNQQVHVALGINEPASSRHPCFKLADEKALRDLQARIWDHHLRGDKAAPLATDKPGEAASGAKGVEYPTRFFARDFAGNRLEFSL